MKRHFSPTFVCTIALLFSGAAAAAEVYRWVDAEGNVHFGDRPKSGGEEVQIRTADATEASTVPDDAAAAEVRSQHCEQASKRLADYEKADTLVGEDEYGRKRDIGNDERVEIILRARKDVEEFCGEVAATAPGEPAPVKSAPAATEEATPPADESSPPAPAEPPSEEPAPAADAGGGGSY